MPFIKLRCVGCKNEQQVFKSSSTKVKCLICGKDLASNTGGKISPKTVQVGK